MVLEVVVPEEGNSLRAVLPLMRSYLVSFKIIIMLLFFKKE